MNSSTDILARLIADMPEYKFMMLAGQYGFECEKCGQCCQCDRIALNNSDIVKLMTHDCGVNISKDENGTCIKSEGNCPYHSDVGCSIYRIRPYTCRLYPFLSVDPTVPEFHLYRDCPGVVKLVDDITETHEDMNLLSSPIEAQFIKMVLLALYAKDYNSRKLRILLEKCGLYKYPTNKIEDLHDMCVRFMRTNIRMLEE